MASLLSPRRTDDPSRSTVSLHTSETVRARSPEDEIDPVSWPVAAFVGGLTTAATGWILVSGVVALGWVLTEPGTLRGALELGTRLWLLANGVSVQIGTLPVTVVPLGVTAVLAALTWRFGRYAIRRVRPGQDVGPLLVAGVLTGTSALPVLGAAVFFGEPWHAPLHWAAVLVLLFGAALAGASGGRGVGLTSTWPSWLQGFPRAVGAAMLVLLVAGAAVLVVGLVGGWDRVEALTRALHPGVAGGILLVLAQATVLPNFVLWSGSYALGAGFTLGNGSVVAPAATSLGVLPGLPVLGALPAAGPGGTHQLWWLAAGVLAGATAAWVVLRRGAGTRVDRASLLGGVAGLSAALVLVGLAWLSSGDLGAVRLAGLGPRLLPLLVMSTTTLGLSGLLTGAVVWVVRRLRRPAEAGRPGPGPAPAEGEDPAR